MKLRAFLVVLFFTPILVFSTSGKMSGSGTEQNPWQIADYEDLKAVGTGDYTMDGHYKLVADIDASASKDENCYQDTCYGFAPIGIPGDFPAGSIAGFVQDWVGASFEGVINGAGHKITGMYSGEDHYMYAGLILLNEGKVDSLTIVNGRFVSGERAGAIAAVNEGTITNCVLENVSVESVALTGGVAGTNSGLIQNVKFSGVVKGIKDREEIGGVVGYNEETGEIRNVEITADMTTDYYGKKIGGAVGVNLGKIVNVKVSGATSRGFTCSGGFVGENKGLIDSCYTSVSIEGTNNRIGGFVGCNGGTIKSSTVESDSVVSTSDVAGFVANNDSTGVIDNCSSNTMVKASAPHVAAFADSNWGVITNSHSSGLVDASQVGGSGFVYANLGTIKGSSSNVLVKTLSNGAGFVSQNRGTIDSCYAEGDTYNLGNAAGDCFGGFVGLNDTLGRISHSYATGVASGGMNVGGFVGKNNGIIDHCYATGDSHSYSVYGGFVGVNTGSIELCYATGNVSRMETENNSYTAGGFAGTNSGTISRAYSAGNVASGYTAAGFVSLNYGAINDAFAVGNVDGFIEFGGFVVHNSGSIENAFYSGKVVGNADSLREKSSMQKEPVGFSCFEATNDEPGTIVNSFWNIDSCTTDSVTLAVGKTTDQLAMKSTFDTWSFDDDNWTIEEGKSYPYLSILDKPRIEAAFDSSRTAVERRYAVSSRIQGFSVSRVGEDLMAGFELAAAGHVRIAVINVQGRVLKNIALGKMTAGTHQASLRMGDLPRNRYNVLLFLDGKVIGRSVARN